MLEKLNLTRKITKEEFKKTYAGLEQRLMLLQREAFNLKIPIIIVFEGWDASGKGTLINELILPLDPRGFTVHSTLPPNEQEALFPFLWRFWTRTPARGRIAVFDRSWYRSVLTDRVDGSRKRKELQQAFEDIRSFERQLADDGNVIIKFFLHISKKEQKQRFKTLLSDKHTVWRVTKGDLSRHKQYGKYIKATEDLLVETDTDFAPWTVIEAHDHRFATLKTFKTIIATIEKAVAENRKKTTAQHPKSKKTAKDNLKNTDNYAIFDGINTTLELEHDEYRKKLKKQQDALRDLEHRIYMARVPVVIVYEGWDAAGKGGNIRRLAQNLDPRGYNVVPISAPNDVEKAHHYLWRFWSQMPKAGHITIFDRSWYGRVMVERVEGFCTETEWKRAFMEINEMEKHMAHFGAVIVKLWLHIDKDEQLRRFKERQDNPHKQWKITAEDWRNRKKWDAYHNAVEEMIFRTSTPYAPWTIIESNCKWFARVKALETVTNAIKSAL